ncbi:MAG: hypothetical protein KTR32_24035 [Granulosicoccus sp.]|nr:hypothetical protein [Granulosicoccus sp.]
MHLASSLIFRDFDERFQTEFPSSRQFRYLCCYLRDLGVVSIVEEPHYFDRDYLSEFAAFYSVSSRGYSNSCRRLHFFSARIDRELFVAAVSNQDKARWTLHSEYLGFCVIRPITATPLGCTVLRWYPQTSPDTLRITEPCRDYHCHVAGLTLRVNGLAWQQQDSAVGACATIGLWSMLHSSSFDNDRTAPTTAEITQAANMTAVTGSRVFPSEGLTIIQLLEAIKRYRHAPFAISGDIRPAAGITNTDSVERNAGFSKERFSSTCASFIRSGYPILAIGELVGVGRHAMCITGFRELPPGPIEASAVKAADEAIEHFYIHDDNLGPNVRFGVHTRSQFGQVNLIADPPGYKRAGSNPSPTLDHPHFIPQQLVVCTHEELRTSPDKLNGKGLEIGAAFIEEMNRLLIMSDRPLRGVYYSCRFMLISDYLDRELGSMFRNQASGQLLGRLRMELSERVVPMSKYVGVVRISLEDATPVLDVLFDTSDSDVNLPVFAHLSFGLNVCRIVEEIEGFETGRFGVQIKAFDSDL